MYEEDLDSLDDALRRLKIEYRIFLSGNRKKAPDDLRVRVERLVKKLSECGDLNFSQRFRFNTLVTRFYVYRDLWRREVQSLEMGAASAGTPAPKAPAEAPKKSVPAEALRVSITDPDAEEAKVRQLYDVLMRIRKKDAGETPISYRQFSKYIATQTFGLRRKYGCAKVAFTIATDEDSLRFTASADNS